MVDISESTTSWQERPPRPSTAQDSLPESSPAAVVSGPINLAERLVTRHRQGDKHAFVTSRGATDYRRLDVEVRTTASALELLGIDAGDRVLIALDDDVELVRIFYGCLAMGALPVVINPNLDADAMAMLMRDCRPAGVFGKAVQAAIIRDAASEAMLAAEPILIVDSRSEGRWHPVGTDDRWNGFFFRPPEQPVLIQYTSGSTGRPKGVMHSAAAVLSCCEHVAARHLRLTSSDIIYSVSKAFFGYGMGNSLFFSLYVGATAILDPIWPSGASVAANLVRFRPSVLFSAPTMYRMLLDAPLDSDNASVRLAISAGSPLPWATVVAWRRRFGMPLHNGLGSTELLHLYTSDVGASGTAGGVGRVIDGVQAVVIGADGGPVMPGETGELIVRAPYRAAGYWQETPSGTAPTESDLAGDSWFRTGDLVTQDADGVLLFNGRKDDRFKASGRWVAPLEIENLLVARFPLMGEMFVVPGMDDAGEQRPVLLVHASGEAVRTMDPVKLFEEELQRHQRPVLYLAIAAIPLNANGKPDRRALSAIADDALRGQAVSDKGTQP